MKASGWVQVLRVACVLFGAQAAAAEMLDEPACNQLKGEQARLSAAGVQTEMLYGPDWAKANLPASRLEEIKRLMEVEEQLSFRCPGPAPLQPVEPVAAVSTEDGAVAQPKSQRKKKAAKKAEDATAGVAADPAAHAEKPNPKTKPKRKPAANDAYVPPLDPGGAISSAPGEPSPQPPPQGAPSRR